MPDNGVILVFTDEQSAQLHLESAVTAEATRKNVKVFVALLGDLAHKGNPGLESEQAYERVSEGRIFRSTAGQFHGTVAFDSNAFFEAVLRKVMSD